MTEAEHKSLTGRPYSAAETRPVLYYGCCKCGVYHEEHEPLFLPHTFFQSKQGVQDRPATGEDVIRRMGEG